MNLQNNHPSVDSQLSVQTSVRIAEVNTFTCKYDEVLVNPSGELGGLKNVINSIKAQSTAFACFQGENAQLDALIRNVNLIIQKQSCSTSLGLTSTSARADSVGESEVTFLLSSVTQRVSVARSGLESLSENRSSSKVEVERLRVALEQIKLQLSAFRFFASDCSHLNLYLQNLDVIIANRKKAQIPSAVSPVKQERQEELNALESADAEIIDLTFEDGCNQSEQEAEDISILDLTNTGENEFLTQNENISGNAQMTDGSTDVIVFHNNIAASHDNQNRPGTSAAALAYESRKRSLNSSNVVRDENSVATAVVVPYAAKKIKTEKDSSPLPGQKILATDVVMIKILDFLSTDNLKQLRVVSRRFNLFATQALRRRTSYKVKFTYDWFIKAYVSAAYSKVTKVGSRLETHNKVKEGYTLQRLMTLLKQWTDFPCCYFMFLGGTLKSPDLQEFLTSSHRKMVTRLYLDIFCLPTRASVTESVDASGNRHTNVDEFTYPSIYSLKNLLVSQLTNLNYLELHNFPSQWKSSYERLFPEPKGKEIRLQNLKSLAVGKNAPSKIFADLLKVGGNLTLLETSSPSNILCLQKSNRFHLLRKLTWKPSFEHFEEILAFAIELLPANFLSRLEILSVFFGSLPGTGGEHEEPALLSRLSMALNNILESSSSTLKEFHMASRLGLLPNFEFPSLPKVKILKIGRFSENPTLIPHHYQPFELGKPYFPPNFQFGASFPNLNCVQFDFGGLKKLANWDHYFTNVQGFETAPTVKSLVVESRNHVPKDWFGKIMEIFRDVENVEIKTTAFSFVENASILWGLAKLKNLKFRIDVSALENMYPALDSAFTGFSKDTCVELQDSSDAVDISTIDKFRENPSIVNATDLRSIQIVFVDYSQIVRQEYPPYLTHVAGLFAFQMCPKLMVCFWSKGNSKTGNNNRLLESLRPLHQYVSRMRSSDRRNVFADED